MRVDPLLVRSQFKDYTVTWIDFSDEAYRRAFKSCRAAVIDENVLNLYGNEKSTFGVLEHIVVQRAVEELKTPEAALSICRELLQMGLKRGETVLAIGGGIVQDIVTFATSILFRGVPWTFVPTTLLAQADSCIGGKSSLNIGTWKNQIGNFFPPQSIFIATQYLDTLSAREIQSGIGEIIKVHLLSGRGMVERIADDIKHFANDRERLLGAMHRALNVKAATIMEDEFDQGKRLNLNYGHTFGHALEAATDFAVPHGIAVTVGVDMANYLAMRLGRITEAEYDYLHSIVEFNMPKERPRVEDGAYLNALRHDKKNRRGEYCFILPREVGSVDRTFIPMNDEVESFVTDYLSAMTGE